MRASGRCVILHGARVKTLAEGRWKVAWSGTDESGREAPPGVYFLRLLTRDGAESRRVVKMK